MRRWLPELALIAGIASAIGLLLPWTRVGSRPRSSIELVGGAVALEIFEGRSKAIVILCWMLIPILVSASMIALAAQRRRLSAALLLPLGGVLGPVALLVFFMSDAVAWGAWLTGICGLGASACAVGFFLVGSDSDRPLPRARQQ